MVSHFLIGHQLKRYLASEIYSSMQQKKINESLGSYWIFLKRWFWQLSAGVVLPKQRMCTELGFGGISSNDLHEGIMTMEEMNVWYCQSWWVACSYFHVWIYRIYHPSFEKLYIAA